MKTLTERLHLDGPLLLGLLLLISLGSLVLYSASGQDMDTLLRHGARMGLGLGVMLALAQAPPALLRVWAPWLYGAAVLLLVAVLAAGIVGKGAQRWLDLGFMRFQPSEIMKLAMPILLAHYLGSRGMPPRWPHVLIAAALILVPALLIAKQPDLGTSLLVGASGFFVLFLAGLSWRLLLGLGLACAAFAPIAYHFLLHDYQRRRILTLLDPGSDPLGAGWHTIQGEIALGSGGAYGKGWLEGTQSQLEFLPERHTDFISAVIGEELGFLGMLLFITLYAFIIGRSLMIAATGQDLFARLLAGSIGLTFSVYVFVNIGMVAGLLPVVGVPLPLVSYGGTAAVTLLAGFGMLMSIQTHRRLFRHEGF
jgi:rod shape determining protein RodA